MKLGEIATVRTGLVLSRKQSILHTGTEVNYNLMNLKCILDTGDIDINLLDTYEASERLKSDYLTRKGDVVVRLSNPYTAVLITDYTEGLVISSHFVKIRTDDKNLIPEYLYWLLNTDKIKKDIQQKISGNMLGTIKPSYFAELDIKQLTIEKQKVLANINLTAKKESELLEELRQQKLLYYKILTNQIQKGLRRGN